MLLNIQGRIVLEMFRLAPTYVLTQEAREGSAMRIVIRGRHINMT